MPWTIDVTMVDAILRSSKSSPKDAINFFKVIIMFSPQPTNTVYNIQKTVVVAYEFNGATHRPKLRD